MNNHFGEGNPKDRNGHRRNGEPRNAFADMRPTLASHVFRTTGAGSIGGFGKPPENPNIRWNEAESRFQLEDARIVTRGNRGFCLRLIEILVLARKVRAAHLEFPRHRLAVEFADRNTSRSEAARILGDSIRLASMPVHAGNKFEFVPLRQNWESFAFFADSDRQPTCWWWIENESGHVKIDGSGLNVPGVDPRLWSETISGVRSSRRYRFSRSVRLKYDRDRANLWNIVNSIDELCRSIAAGNAIGTSTTRNELSPASRFVHLGLAAGFFTCTVVGILIPGVPTVPFVLMTSYHLAKSSQRLHDAFRRTPLFGSLGDDWEKGRYIRTTNKIWLITISTGVLVVSLSMTQPTGAVLMTIVTIYSLTTASVLLVPGNSQRLELPGIIPGREPALLPG